MFWLVPAWTAWTHAVALFTTYMHTSNPLDIYNMLNIICHIDINICHVNIHYDMYGNILRIHIAHLSISLSSDRIYSLIVMRCIYESAFAGKNMIKIHFLNCCIFSRSKSNAIPRHVSGKQRGASVCGCGGGLCKPE